MWRGFLGGVGRGSQFSRKGHQQQIKEQVGTPAAWAEVLLRGIQNHGKAKKAVRPSSRDSHQNSHCVLSHGSSLGLGWKQLLAFSGRRLPGPCLGAGTSSDGPKHHRAAVYEPTGKRSFGVRACVYRDPWAQGEGSLLVDVVRVVRAHCSGLRRPGGGGGALGLPGDRGSASRVACGLHPLCETSYFRRRT